MRRGVVWLLVLVVLAGIAWYIDLPDILKAWVHRLASHPGVVKAFADPRDGRIDALILLVTVFLLTPIVLGFILVGFIFVLIVFALLVEPVMRMLRVPLWTSVPLVLGGSGLAAYVMRAAWFPNVLYVVRLTAKAGVVFFSSGPVVPR